MKKFHFVLGRALTLKVSLQPEPEADAMKAASARVIEKCPSLVELHVERTDPWALILVSDTGDLAADIESAMREVVRAWGGWIEGG